MRQRTECFECGGEFDVLHHVVPASRGGTKTVPLCGACHAKAHHSEQNMATRTLTTAALHSMQKRGLRTGGVPYGWVLGEDGVSLVASAEEQSVAKEIVALVDSGKSLRVIADHLNARGVPTKKGIGPWRHTAVKGVFVRNKRLKEER